MKTKCRKKGTNTLKLWQWKAYLQVPSSYFITVILTSVSIKKTRNLAIFTSVGIFAFQHENRRNNTDTVHTSQHLQYLQLPCGKWLASSVLQRQRSLVFCNGLEILVVERPLLRPSYYDVENLSSCVVFSNVFALGFDLQILNVWFFISGYMAT
jgi:hypothetical protein